ncbi:prolyl oligopeptidase family serine peptidase [bacterium]|nr:prolyl oligopeptidase family serine peptidase [bacterium]
MKPWKAACTLSLLFILSLHAQDRPELTVAGIMRDQAWIGSSPGRPFWALDASRIYFTWNPENAPDDSLYAVDPAGGNPEKVTLAEQALLPGFRGVVYSKDRTRVLFTRFGDIYEREVGSGKEKQLTATAANESSPRYCRDEEKIVFEMQGNLYILDRGRGTLAQITDFSDDREGGARRRRGGGLSAQEEWLREQATGLSIVLTERKARREAREAAGEVMPEAERPLSIALDGSRVGSLDLSPDEAYVYFTLAKRAEGDKRTIVPDYVTESGYTEDIPAHSKVGGPAGSYRFGIYDIGGDTVRYADPATLPGYGRLPGYLAEKAVPSDDTKNKITKPYEGVTYTSPVWSDDGRYAAMSVYSQDSKDRWIVLIHPETAALQVLDHQHDEAWIGGPGTGGWGGGLGWMPDNRSVWFQSEESGWSHLYTVNAETGKKQALTSGPFEIYGPQLSRDKKFWYFTANREHSGVRHFYRMPLHGGPMIRITAGDGAHEVVLSPDEKTLAVRYSTANRPWELYVMPNKPGAAARRVTRSLSEEFLAYPWRIPEYITFTASDGAEVHARLYRPEVPVSDGPGVIFVHGAGYLQNAHKWWSSYSHEYMFHNLLVDHGYTVLDIDYRGSAGYGRDWRTAIYRHMGGKDLSDQVDGAKYLAESCGVDPQRIGIYGGSYGGFITLMALFTEPEVFAAGAALRSVTDWAHYHHSYTADILNTPVADSLAYVRSSPIYFAEGLKGALLMCHGMVDTNVHFQDIVRLTQRLIELGKENWELAVYPVENHGFTEPSSWTDEYRRIFKLFEENLK